MLGERFRPSPRQYTRIVVVSVAALSAIIVTGAAVRLTGSGLGCSDWPNCEQGEFIASLEFHPMVEFINRLITGFVSAAVGVAVLGSLRRRPKRRDLTIWSWSLVVGVVAQIFIGALVTLSELRYSVVAIHFLVSMVLVWAAMVLWKRSTDPEIVAADGTSVAGIERRWTPVGKALALFGSLVLFSGAMVTSAGAHTGARIGHDGEEISIERLPIPIRPLVQTHSVLVWLLCLTTVYCIYRAATSRVAFKESRELLIVVVAQGALGYLQYFSDVPALMVGFHVAGATLVWIMTLRTAFATATVVASDASPVPAPAPATETLAR